MQYLVQSSNVQNTNQLGADRSNFQNVANGINLVEGAMNFGDAEVRKALNL